jgi:Ca-activated chloride channel family protein
LSWLQGRVTVNLLGGSAMPKKILPATLTSAGIAASIVFLLVATLSHASQDGPKKEMIQAQTIESAKASAELFTSDGSQGPIQPAKSGAPSQSNQANEIKVGVNLVLVNATVIDPLDRLVTGLEKENFRVFEDGTEQEVVTLSSEDVPVSIGLIFDMSGSMADKVEKAREAAVQFMRTANPLDQFFLVSFNDRAELTSGFTTSVDELQNRMMFTAAHGRTAMLDAVYLGLTQMRAARHPRRALLIISDGGDNHSRYTEKDVKNFLKEADCELYAIGIYDSIGDRSRSPEELNGPTLLSELTEMTGGRVFAVGNINELPDIAAKIGIELRNQYILGYKPSNNQNNGIWRKIKVKLHPPKGLPPLNVYAKTGYYAPSQ